MLERKAFGSLYEDEPRILRPTEIESLQLHWSLSEFELQDGMEEEVAVVVVSGLIATDMLQCASWCALAPRPAVIGDIEMRIESYEDNRQMSMQIAQTAAQGIDATVELQREMFLDDSFEDDGWSIGLIAMKVQEVEVED
jgi:hypothetical protein